MLTPHSSQLTITTHYSLLTAHSLILTAHYSLLITHCTWPTANSPRLTAKWIIPHCQMVTPHASLPDDSFLKTNCSLLTHFHRHWYHDPLLPVLTTHSSLYIHCYCVYQLLLCIVTTTLYIHYLPVPSFPHERPRRLLWLHHL